MTNAIEVRGLGWSPRGSFQLRDLDISVPEGSIYGFLGPNGSGKSSTIRLLLGMAKPREGSMTVLGRLVPAELPSILLRTGYVPERPHVYRGLTVAEALHVHAGFFPGWDAAWAERMRNEFSLEPRARVSRLSKGEAGKLAILLALAQRPELLVLDEPTDGLDPVVRRDVLSALLEYVAETGATVFISSHLVHELERFCDWVGVLEGGRMLAEMPMEAFRKEVTRVRVAAVPTAVGTDRLSGSPSHRASKLPTELLPAPPTDLPLRLPAGFLDELPFQVLARSPTELGASSETWIVRGWREEMEELLEPAGYHVREVQHLDLEEAFVELLRAARPEEEA